ncbi:glycosyltransferase, group 2 family protein [Lachnoanaerobaculum sp. MSX33]|uniref:glycosyltransferase family 2 protein n=1 Tax=Lachnoanaerobaculum sp. MSX33 TaxID=936596 RepID=UPI0003DFA9CD|nr:glycosyltransferase family 2 protein [Lachnoanaerobaculum sp. MSX33]ETO98517.1 glycosyltransferase, group 2 family protein [Lachnoanaerobaculum sp. MSX33]
MIEILLATYNGERFLPEQIESITSQSFKDYYILASDDNSSDCTFEILRSYESVLGEKIKVVQSNTHSAKENFYNLLDMADAEYIALCDQDDFWESDKLEKSLKAIQRLEKRYGKEMPILVHSDLEIVDENLNSQNKKMSELTGINEAIKYAKKESKYLYTISTEKSFSRYLVENNITGNTVIINKALLDIYKRPEVSFMHDWWLGLIAFTFGKVGYLNECLVKYRQHESNELGANNPLELRNIKRRNKQRIRENYDCMFAQVEEFLRLYKDELGKSRSADTYFARKYLNAFANMKSKNRVSKIRDILKYSFFKSSKILTIGEMLNI